MYNITISRLNDIEVQSEASTILRMNTAANSLPVDGLMISLHPYEVRVIDSHPSLLGTLQMPIGFIASIVLLACQYLKSRRIQGDHKRSPLL